MKIAKTRVLVYFPVDILLARLLCGVDECDILVSYDLRSHMFVLVAYILRRLDASVSTKLYLEPGQ